MHAPTLLIALPVLAAIVLLLSALLHRRSLRLRILLAGVLVLAGGAASLAYQDYHWATGVRDGLPASALIVSQTQETLPLHPWTLLWPPVTRITAIDNAGTAMEANGSLLLEFDLFEFRQNGEARDGAQRLMLNCTSQDLVSHLGDSILIETLPAGDPLLRLLCHPQ